jgi:hypothetical protein
MDGLSEPGARPSQRSTQVTAEADGRDQVEEITAGPVGILAPASSMLASQADAERLPRFAGQGADAPVAALTSACRE